MLFLLLSANKYSARETDITKVRKKMERDSYQRRREKEELFQLPFSLYNKSGVQLL